MPSEINVLEGISGDNKICTLQPFDVLVVFEKPEPPKEEPKEPEAPEEPEKPKDDFPETPADKSPSSVINFIIAILNWLKKFFK